ncbi:unnamed protein product, partial [Tetraodon nigroviridis]
MCAQLVSLLTEEVLLCCPLHVQGPNQRRLLHNLLRDYDKLDRPVTNDSQSLPVELHLSLMQIIDLDEKNQILTTNVFLQMTWNDYYLAWEASEYAGVDTMRLPSHLVWKPDILLYNSADGRFDATYQPNVVVRSSGDCLYVPPMILKSTCRIDVRWFPFDVQKCELKFGSWSYGRSALDLQVTEADISSYTPSGEWDLIAVNGRVNQKQYQCCEETYPDVTFTVVMRRRTLYYRINLLLPCVLISTLALLVFVLPADSGEKISLAVFMLLVAEIMPPTSDSVPIIAQYFATIMVIVGLSVIATVLVLQYHHHDPHGEKMPKWTRVFLLDWCASFLHMKRPGEDPVLLTCPSDHPCSSLTNMELSVSSPDQPTNGTVKSSEAAGAPSSTAGELDKLDKLLDQVRFIAKHFQKQNVDVAVCSDWKFAALVIDRLCLVAFSVLTILCTVGILVLAPSLI